MTPWVGLKTTKQGFDVCDMDHFSSLLIQYSSESSGHNVSEEGFEMCKQYTREYALSRMKTSRHVNELMVIYNMAAHYGPSDPAGIWFLLRSVCGASPLFTVDLFVLGQLLQEMANISDERVQQAIGEVEEESFQGVMEMA